MKEKACWSPIKATKSCKQPASREPLQSSKSAMRIDNEENECSSNTEAGIEKSKLQQLHSISTENSKRGRNRPNGLNQPSVKRRKLTDSILQPSVNTENSNDDIKSGRTSILSDNFEDESSTELESKWSSSACSTLSESSNSSSITSILCSHETNNSHLNKSPSNFEHYWDRVGKLRKLNTNFRWDFDSRFEDGSEVIVNRKIGRAYYSAFFFDDIHYKVGDFVKIPGTKPTELFRIVGAFQAMKSYLGAWNEKTVTDEIQKRGHPYILYVPFIQPKKKNERYFFQNHPDKTKKFRKSIEGNSKTYKASKKEIFLEGRASSSVDGQHIYKLPMWLGDKRLILKKINVDVLTELSNIYFVGKCLSEESKEKIPFLTPLTKEQTRLLTTSSPKALYKKISSSSSSWDLEAKQVQFIRKNVKRGETNSLSDKAPIEINNGSCDESDWNDECNIEEKPKIRENSKCLFQLVAKGNFHGEELFYKKRDELLSKHFEPIQQDIESIVKNDKIGKLHSNIILINDAVAKENGFPKLNNSQKYMCYKAGLKFDVALMSPRDNDIFACSVIPALVETGVTVIVKPDKKDIGDFQERLQMLTGRALKAKTIDLSGEIDRPEGQVANIKILILDKQLKGPCIIFTTPKNLENEKVMSHLESIEKLRMLKRLVFIGFEDTEIIKKCANFQRTPYTLIASKVFSFPSLINQVKSLNGQKREKPILLLPSAESMAFFVERKVRLEQVSNVRFL